MREAEMRRVKPLWLILLAAFSPLRDLTTREDASAQELPGAGRASGPGVAFILGPSKRVGVSSLQETGTAIYEQVSQAVFVLEIESGSAKQRTGLGTAFLVSGGKLITNAHVVEDGTPYLRAGPLRVPCVVHAIDTANDLAVLTIQGGLDAQPLPLARNSPLVGTTVYVLGNPAGLERTLSQGIVSGTRRIEGRQLLQITAPISPGSSGGPVVSARGEVVGVTVGFLESGQNLNFAVPIEALHAVLENSHGKVTDVLPVLMAEISSLEKRKAELEFSSDPDSLWAKTDSRITELLKKAMRAATGSPEALIQVAQKAYDNHEFELASEIVRPLATVGRPNLDAAYLLAQTLRFQAFFAEDEPGRVALLSEAERHASRVVADGSRSDSERVLLLADIVEELPREKTRAHAYFRRSLDLALAERKKQLRHQLLGLFRTSRDLGQDGEALKWFRQLEQRGEADTYAWRLLGGFHDAREQYGEAASAWRRAATMSGEYSDWCEAGHSSYSADQIDLALSALRRCLEEGALESDSEARRALAHRQIGAILFERGVYEEVTVHTKQALTLAPNDGWAFHYLAKALNRLQRYSEAAVAAENAVRVTDGKYGSMHFEAGYAYSELRQCDKAIRSYKKAAELLPTDTAPTYNLALCFMQLGFFQDAARWYEDTLRRDPNHRERATILEEIRRLRGR